MVMNIAEYCTINVLELKLGNFVHFVSRVVPLCILLFGLGNCIYKYFQYIYGSFKSLFVFSQSHKYEDDQSILNNLPVLYFIRII